MNVDRAELDKFDAISNDWWDPQGKLHTLHRINPVRLRYIESAVELTGKTVLDIGCGGGILSEALADKGARVTGVDASETSISIAQQHSISMGLSIRYLACTAENFAENNNERFDVVTCMELLEHVPDPGSVIDAATTLLEPDGDLFLATINRNLMAYLGAIIGAEHILGLLPRGTHQYARFIRPSELAKWLRAAGLEVIDCSGIRYIPGINQVALTRDPTVNYLVHARRRA